MSFRNYLLIIGGGHWLPAHLGALNSKSNVGNRIVEARFVQLVCGFVDLCSGTLDYKLGIDKC